MWIKITIVGLQYVEVPTFKYCKMSPDSTVSQCDCIFCWILDIFCLTNCNSNGPDANVTCFAALDDVVQD